MPRPKTKENSFPVPCSTVHPLKVGAKIYTHIHRAVKKFLSGRLITNSRRLWNSHQMHKFLRTEASKDILEFRVSETLFPGVFKRYFSIADAMLLRQNTRKTGNDAVKVSQAFHNMAWFERFTDLD